MNYWNSTGKFQKAYDYFYTKLVPPQGKANTDEGELLRIIGKFYYRCADGDDYYFCRNSLAFPDISKTIELIKDVNKKVGISLKPRSDIKLIESFLDKIDLVLIMSVEPGFGGKKFIPEVLNKTKKLKEIITKKNLAVDIEIDGGINFENCSKAKKAGANILVSGSTVFKENKGDLKKNIEILRNN